MVGEVGKDDIQHSVNHGKSKSIPKKRHKMYATTLHVHAKGGLFLIMHISTLTCAN